MRVLLVEDDESTAKVVTSALTQQNYAVDVAVDGQSGWEFVEAFGYNLILLDVILPKLDGINLCRRLRQASYQMPILLLTDRNTSTDKVIGLDAGADDCLVKPFDLQELIARIRALLRRGGSSAPPVLQWESLRLDPSTCEVTYEGQLLHLTPKEYGLLKLFLCSSGRVFSRSALLDYLWTFEDPPEEDTIKSHIKSLRRKLKAVGAPTNLIETVYGLGYRLKSLTYEKESRITLPLTKLMNQRESAQVLDQLLCLAKRYNHSLYLAVLELDNLKQIRHQYGYVSVNTVLQQLGQFLQQMLRSSDVVAYWRDGVYALGMYGMTKGDGVRRLAQILEVLHQKEFNGLDGAQLRVTFSTAAVGYPDDGADLPTLCQAVDAALSQQMHRYAQVSPVK